MDTKKKLIMALSSLCGVLLVAVVAMGIVWAATSQTITSNVKVTYTATQIKGSIAANVYFNSDTPTPMTGGTNGTISFDAETSSTGGALTPASEIVLDNVAGKTFVIFEYYITNGSTNVMDAVLSYSDDSTDPNKADENIKVYAYSSATAVAQPWTNVATLQGASGANELGNTTGQFIDSTVPARAGEIDGSKYFYVVVALDDAASDAEFSGTFSWNLTKHTS